VHVDGVPANVIGHMARLAAIEMASCTGVMRRTVFMDVQECVRVYDLKLDDCYSINQISQVCYNDQIMRPDRVLACCPTTSCSYHFERPDCFYIGLEPRCDMTRALEIHMTVIPGQDSCYIDKHVYDLYAETLAAGALYRIFMMKDEPWFDVALSRIHGANFNAGASKARIRDLSGNSAEPTRMKIPKGFWF
jgi:hypothetical protein